MNVLTLVLALLHANGIHILGYPNNLLLSFCPEGEPLTDDTGLEEVWLDPQPTKLGSGTQCQKYLGWVLYKAKNKVFLP